jgi:hypothetical protein
MAHNCVTATARSATAKALGLAVPLSILLRADEQVK